MEPLPPVENKPMLMQQAQQAPVLPPQNLASLTPAPAPPAPIIQPVVEAAPPPQLVDPGNEDSAIIKRRKSKRKELQQASSGTDALRIPLDRSKTIGNATGGTGSTGLNIPK